MRQVTIRPATLDDADWIVTRLPVLDRMYGARQALLDPYYARAVLPMWITSHCVLVAADENWRLGFVAGLLTPHILSPKVTVLTEALWYAADARAGLALLDAFTAWGRERRADWVMFSLMAASPAGRAALARRGYRVAETQYLLEPR